MRRFLNALPYLFLIAAVGVAGWLAWTIVGPRFGPVELDTDVRATTTLPASTTTRPADWVESCESVLAALQDEGWAVVEASGDLNRLAQDAQAGIRSWYGVVDVAQEQVIPRLEQLVGSTRAVLDTNPETVSRIYAEDFRDAATPLPAQARELITTVIDPETGRVGQGAWTAWWAEWTGSLPKLNLVLDRAPASVQNCPD